MKQTKEQELNEIRMNRNIKMPEAIWQRFQKGEVNLIDNLWNELGDMIKITNETNIKLAKQEGFNLAIKDTLEILEDLQRKLILYAETTSEGAYALQTLSKIKYEFEPYIERLNKLQLEKL